jgi:hypothetical protein
MPTKKRKFLVDLFFGVWREKERDVGIIAFSNDNMWKE